MCAWDVFNFVVICWKAVLKNWQNVFVIELWAFILKSLPGSVPLSSGCCNKQSTGRKLRFCCVYQGFVCNGSPNERQRSLPKTKLSVPGGKWKTNEKLLGVRDVIGGSHMANMLATWLTTFLYRCYPSTGCTLCSFAKPGKCGAGAFLLLHTEDHCETISPPAVS